MAGRGVTEVAVAKLVRPQDVQARVEEVPEGVAAVAVLVEDEAFADAGPGEKVDCIAVGDGLGWTWDIVSTL